MRLVSYSSDMAFNQVRPVQCPHSYGFAATATHQPGNIEAQTTTPFGGCTDSRNPDPRPTDYPCWNPQRPIFN